jgi:hypothetical protein
MAGGVLRLCARALPAVDVVQIALDSAQDLSLKTRSARRKNKGAACAPVLPRPRVCTTYHVPRPTPGVIRAACSAPAACGSGSMTLATGYWGGWGRGLWAI